MNTIRMHLQHYLNPLHIMCRIMDMGIPARRAAIWAGIYEMHIYRRFQAAGII